MKKFMKYIDMLLIAMGVIFVLVLTTCEAEAQIKGNLRASFLYNTDITYNNHKPHILQSNWIDVTHNYHQNFVFEADVFVPFNSFEDGSIVKSDKFFFYGRGGLILDHTTIRNSLWTFNLEFQPVKSQPIFLKAEIDATQTTGHKYPSYKEPRIDGEEFYVSIHYNNQKHKRQYDSFVNFFAQLDYLVHSKYMTIDPYVRELNQDNSTAFRTIIGLVVNIKDVIYLEQGMTTLTEQFLFDAVTFTPYNSYYTTKAWVTYKKTSVAYEHICHHPLYSANKNPLIGGVSNRVYLNFAF